MHIAHACGGLTHARSIFIRHKGPAPGQDGPPPPEAGLAFRGVGMLDGQYTAFIEDMASKAVRLLRAGDSIGRGRIANITINALEYEAGGKKVQVALGHSLAGAPLPAPPPQPGPGGPGAPGQGAMPGGPGGPGGPVPPGGPPGATRPPAGRGGRTASAGQPMQASEVIAGNPAAGPPPAQ